MYEAKPSAKHHTRLCVCMSVCPFPRMFPELHARSLPNFCICCLWPWLDPPPAGWRNPREKKQFWGFLLQWQRIAQIAFKTHTKTAETIDMPFGVMNGLGPRNSVLCRGDDPWRGMGNFGGNMFPTRLIPLIMANRTGPCSCTRQEQTLDCKRWTSPLSTVVVGLHTVGEVWYLQLPCLFVCFSARYLTNRRS